MKKSLCISLVLALSAFVVFSADYFNYAIKNFTDVVQDLAVQTACLGGYDTSRTPNPLPLEEEKKLDKYEYSMMRERFAQMYGNQTETPTFAGLCFNYAKHAYEDIEQYKKLYNERGMYENKFWIAGVHDNPNEIQLQYPGTINNHTTVQNGVYVTYPNGGLRDVKTHRLMNKGDRATNHAWLWIERADGVQFWIDPTWTDNLGYVVYGYVSSNGEEIQCRPNREFCINYPAELNNLPLPPPMGTRKAASPSANSTDRNEIINDSGIDWITLVNPLTFLNFFTKGSGKFRDNYNALVVSVNVPFSSIKDRSLSINKMCFSLEMPCLYDYSHILGVEYLRNSESDYNINGGLLTIDFARRLTNNVAMYFGGGIGLRFDALNKDKRYAPKKDVTHLPGNSWFAFKANAGFLFNISRVFTKIDVAYDNVLGFSAGVGMGFAFYHEKGK